MFSAFLVRFLPSRTIGIADLTGFRMAAAWLALLRRYDPALSALLHDDAAWPRGLKPYTISAAGWAPPSPGTKSSDGPTVAEFRVTLLDGDLLGPVISALTQCADVFLPGNRPGPVVSLEMDQQRARWAGWVTRSRLCEAAPDFESASLLVASPAAFRATAGGGAAYVSRPDPALLVGSLLSKWDAHVGIPLDQRLVQQLKRRIRLTATRVELGSATVGRQSFTGFTGLVDLRAPDRATGKVLNALLALAFYAGVGMRTGDGMGQALPVSAGAAASARTQGRFR